MALYKRHALPGEVIFLLTTGGHNAGIVSGLGKSGGRFQVPTKAAENRYLVPDTWVGVAPRADGSWWPTWTRWLADLSGIATAPPRLGAPDTGHPPIGEAPGTYVLQV